MQKLLFVSHLAELTGGAEKTLLEIILKFQKRGYSCTVILPGTGDFSTKLDTENIPYHVMTYAWSLYSEDDGSDPNREKNVALWNASNMTALRDIIIDIEPAAVITNTIVVPWAMYVAKALGIPNIILIHEWIFRDNAIKLAPESHECLKMIASYADWIFFNSFDSQENYKKYLPNSGTSVMYPDLGVTETIFESKYVENKIGQKLSILVAGAIALNKNQIEAFKGIEGAIEKGVPIEKVLFIGGQGDIDYYKELENEVARSSFFDRVGFQEHTDDFFDIVNQFNIVIVPSKSETFGRITAEAQVFGRVVIASRIGGTTELIEDGKTGLLYDLGKIEELTKKIDWVYKNRKEAEKIAKQAMTLQKDRFISVDLLVPLEEAINTIIEKKSNIKRDRSFDPLFMSMAKTDYLLDEIEKIRNSHSFKFGYRALTPLRFIKGKINGEDFE